MKKYFVYILECSDKTLYTGYSTDIEKRLKKHNDGKGAKYTRGRRPCKLKWFQQFETKSEALKMEHKIKKMNRKNKLLLFVKSTNFSIGTSTSTTSISTFLP